MPNYDSTGFNPPAPLARVTLGNQSTGATRTDVPMLLDTGADVTLVPRWVIDQLDLSPVPGKGFELVGFDGTTSLAQVCQAELIFLNRTFRGQFLLIENEWGILGRNVLNAVSLCLEGTRLNWEEFNPG
jgi:predicted aspartyl protease